MNIPHPQPGPQGSHLNLSQTSARTHTHQRTAPMASFLLLALLRTAAAESHYDVLGVASDAAPDAIRAAFRRIALADHPDKLPPDSAAAVREAAVRRFQRANEASSLRPCAPTRTCHEPRYLLGTFLLGL